MLSRDRSDAGRRLAEKLTHYAGRDDVCVLALARGGVPVGYEVALASSAPLDAFVVRKLGVPGQEELAMGAIASGDVRVMNQPLVDRLGIPDWRINAITDHERQELKRREQAYRGHRPLLSVSGKVVILVDDGLATGSTMRAAVAALRRREPRRIVVAVPVEEENEENDHGYRKWSEQEFYRAVTLPADVDASKVNAHYRNGMLEVKLPKAENSRTQKIAVQG